MDADEEKHILYEKTEVFKSQFFCLWCALHIEHSLKIQISLSFFYYLMGAHQGEVAKNLILLYFSDKQVTGYELKPGGSNIRVTEETKHEYVDLVADHILTNAIRPQINSFMEGFNELVPKELISIFNDKELELLISGLPEIDCEFVWLPMLYICMKLLLCPLKHLNGDFLCSG